MRQNSIMKWKRGCVEKFPEFGVQTKAELYIDPIPFSHFILKNLPKKRRFIEEKNRSIIAYDKNFKIFFKKRNYSLK